MRVGFDAGGYEWTTVASVRIPCIENGPGAAASALRSNRISDVAAPSGAGIPSWAITLGIFVLLAFVRIGCRMAQN